MRSHATGSSAVCLPADIGPSLAAHRNTQHDLLRPLHVDFVEEPPVLVPALGICGDVSEADSWLSTSCGENGRRERNELRQFPEILGGGG
jgi:hypothetical protein